MSTQNTQAHTAGPWRTKPNRARQVISEHGKLICTAVLRDMGTTKQNKNGKSEAEAQANAARIVACVNALDGLNPDAIAGVVRHLKTAIAVLDKSQIIWMGIDSAKKALAELEAQS